MSGDQLSLDSKGRLRMRVTLPMPPSDNKIYSNLPPRSVKGKGGRTFLVPGGRMLTKEGKAFHQFVKDAIGELTLNSTLEFRQDVPYTLIVKVYFENVENHLWFKKKRNGQRYAKSRYKKLDSTNRVKLVTDAVSEVIGVDDRHHFQTIIHKREDADNPRLQVVIREQEPRDG